ncbi:3',5'-cyclic-nucleotide phosphodiesterase [Linnemannia gamsii]|uniref:Phosphodiesterase n=1 Tax=Linnemannia gamsii TaxID=64522 RepID=A0ABQ7K1G9_9FUNG|nr:3',5'-cyclic-nucleotide phosphodiesterase [Linnemannia gamsii]
MILLVDVDTDLDLTPPHSPGSYSTRQATSRTSNLRNGHLGVSADNLPQGNGQRHLRAVSDSTVPNGTRNHNSRHGQNGHAKRNSAKGGSCGQEFLECVLQNLANGSLHHVVPVALSSAKSQDKILQLFNLGVADVLLKPFEEQAARTLFLNVHRYSKYRTAVTIPRYASQKNTLTLESHDRLRNVFLKDQWLSDILVNHYCPTPTKVSLRDFPSMSSVAAKERVDHLKRRLLSWDFHPHDLCQDDLMRCVVIVIQEVMKLDGLGDLNIPDHLLHRFVIGLRDSYHRSNPYHNFAHAVDVLQATFYFLCRMGKLPSSGYGYPPIATTPNGEAAGALNGEADHKDSTTDAQETDSSANIPTDNFSADRDVSPAIHVSDFLRPEDIFALLVASIGHDVGHPGVNNMFLVNAHTPLAQVYNDRSVLESFHSMALFQVMKKHGFECFDVDSQNRKFMEFRKCVVSTILATDMGLHFDYVGKIKEQTERLRLRNLPGGNILKPNQANIDEQERLVLCGSLIKCADISNASRPFHVAERWSSVLLQEMCNQADIEKEMAVASGSQSVPAGSTKSLANDRGMQIDSQLGFIHGFAMPLFSSVKEMVPEMGYCVDLLQVNHKIWEDRKTEYLKNGGGSFLSSLISRPVTVTVPVVEEDTPRITASPKRPGHHGRAKSATGRTSQSANPSASKEGPMPSLPRRAAAGSGDLAIPVKVGNLRRSPSANTTSTSGSDMTNGSSGSAIPRPRTARTKAATSEGEVNAENYGQPAGRQGSQGTARSSGVPRPEGRHRSATTREQSSRSRSATTATSLPLAAARAAGAHSDSARSRSNLSFSKSDSRPDSPRSQHEHHQSQQPNGHPGGGSSKSNSRGPKSPGRRSHHRGPGSKKTIVLDFGGMTGGSEESMPPNHSETVALGSLLAVPPPALAAAASSPLGTDSTTAVSEPSTLILSSSSSQSNLVLPSSSSTSPTTTSSTSTTRIAQSTSRSTNKILSSPPQRSSLPSPASEVHNSIGDRR